MAEWQDIVVPKPKEPYKQNLPFRQTYNEYGYNHNNGMYSLVEENRDFRKYIENEIRMEEVKTQNILGKHITEEADRVVGRVNLNTNTRATEIKEKIDAHHTYVVDTLQPKIEEIDRKADVNKGLLDLIWGKVRTLF